MALLSDLQDSGHIKYYFDGPQPQLQPFEVTTMKIVRTAILLLMVSTTMPAFAQGLEEEIQALKTYCKPDIERLCPNVEPGGGRIKACLMAQRELLTVGCAQALQELKKIKQSK